MRAPRIFTVGPAKVDPKLPLYFAEAMQTGVCAWHHRGEPFKKMLQDTFSLLKARLDVPADYTVVLASSARECWEIIAQSFTKKGSLHLFNGAFGAQWYAAAKGLHQGARELRFAVQGLPSPEACAQTKEAAQTDILCLTQNETAHGTQIPCAMLKTFKAHFNHLLAVDATSSLGGLLLPIAACDICFASVQKCLGLPAGMALMICSPRAISQAEAIGEYAHYNSFLRLLSNVRKYETPYTPNILSIYFLYRSLQHRPPMEHIHQIIENRYQAWCAFFERSAYFNLFAEEETSRSRTVLSVQTARPQAVREALFLKGIWVSKGYGAYEEKMIRLANFPFITQEEMTILQRALADFSG